MTSVHHAAIFRYKEYIDEVSRFEVYSSEKDNYSIISERARLSIKQLEEKWPIRIDPGYLDESGLPKEVQDWPLYHHGDGPLMHEDHIKDIKLSSIELGYWFRILLAKYLTPCSQSPSGNWSVLNLAFKRLGWTSNERELLFLGLPPYKLIRQDITETNPWPPNEKSPYWFHLHPYGAKSGWLPVETVNEMYNKLYKTKEEIDVFDVRKIPNINIDNPVVIRSYKEYLHLAFEDTVSMYSSAKEQGEGLFMSITLLGEGF